MPGTSRHRSKRTKHTTSRSRSRSTRSRSKRTRSRRKHALRIKRRRANSLLGGANVECPICSESLRDASTYAREGEDALKVVTPNTCTHRFHEACLNKIRGDKCPVCRRAFTSFLSSAPDVLNVEQERREEEEQAELTRRAAEAARRQAETAREPVRQPVREPERQPVREAVQEPREKRQTRQTIPEFDSRVYYRRRQVELLETVPVIQTVPVIEFF